ncbi:MAG TPA: MarP family serine protease [Candidatus Saccharimonadales bacterium]
MNWLDLFVGLFLVAALIRGSEVGFVRQFFSTLGFFTGLFLGAWINMLLANIVSTPGARALLTFVVVLSFALTLMVAGEYIGLLLKFRLREAQLTNRLDKIFGSALAAATLLAAVWLGASIFRNIPDSGWQRQIRNSQIVAFLESKLPSAPSALTELGRLIDPNNFPQVFTGLEPALKTDTPLPEMGELTPAVQKARASIVKIEGEGCDKVVEGSGFVAGDGSVVTNAHVVAGVKHPFVLDQNGRHSAKVVLFDPQLDIAILRAENLAGEPLPVETQLAAGNTPAAVLGYPSGSGFTAGPGVILETFVAQGRNIYNQGSTKREVYSVRADVEHGNSGGPVINKDGEVIGVIFAKSINYQHVGYALTMEQVLANIDKVRGLTEGTSTSSCAE